MIRQYSRRSFFLFLALGIAFAVAVSVLFVGEAEAKKKKKLRPVYRTSTVAQSGFSGEIAGGGAPLTASGAPYAFSVPKRVHRLAEIEVTLTLEDGNTGPGEEDENNLTLVLDGLDTGIELNGFGAGQTNTKTVSGYPNNAPWILKKLKEDGRLEASLLDADPGDNEVAVPSASNTTLTVVGWPKCAKKRKC